MVVFSTSCGIFRQKRLLKQQKECVYEDVRFIGTFVAMREGIAQFERLKGGTEIIVMDSVKITGALTRDVMVRVKVRRSPGGVCGPTTGEVLKM